jgi:GntR family transcriptional repressor for pyruvate dehydrogenase complex
VREPDIPPLMNEGTRTDRAVQLLTELVTSGTYLPGEYLPSEPTLSKQLGVSRTTVRLALKTLELRGLVVMRRGIGVLVADRTQEVAMESLRMMLLQSGGNTLDAYEVRLMLECESAELAAERATDEEIEEMGDSIDRMQAPGLTIDQRIDIDLEFHLRLCEASKNQMLVALAQVLRGLLRETIKATYLVDEREMPRTIEHTRILEQVKCRNSQGAHAAMDIHMRSAAKGARA